MSIRDELKAELADAMKARDARRRDVIRQVMTEIAKADTAGGEGPLDDEGVRQIIASYCKRMAKAAEEYDGLGDRGEEMAAKLRYEVDYLSRWLPRQLDEAATEKLVADTIDRLGAAGPADVGRVMGAIMAGHKGEVDGSLVSRLVKERLS